MSTSLLYHTFGVRDVVYQKTEYKEGITIIHATPSTKAIRCGTCSSERVTLKGRIERIFRTLPVGNKPVKIVCSIPRVQCKDCGNIRQIPIPFAEPRRTYTRSFERYVLGLCRCMTLQDVAHHLQVSWDVVKGIEKRYLQRHFSRPKLKNVRQIAIDEISIGKGHKYLTVVLDLERGAILFVGEGKGADSLKPFWKKLRISKANIEAVAIDMSRAYIAAVSTNLPKAFIVFDRFHVMKLFNNRLSNFRRELYSQMKDKTLRDVLKGTRWLLLKNPENLNPDRNEKERLDEALALNESLAKVYYMKDLLRLFWELSNYDEAEKFLEDWIADAVSSGISMLYGMAKTLIRHQEGLLAYYCYPISTGPLEGTNNKIKTMKRQAYGYRDHEFFMLKIFAIHQSKYALVG
jgi:transposase